MEESTWLPPPPPPPPPPPSDVRGLKLQLSAITVLFLDEENEKVPKLKYLLYLLFRNLGKNTVL